MDWIYFTWKYFFLNIFYKIKLMKKRETDRPIFTVIRHLCTSISIRQFQSFRRQICLLYHCAWWLRKRWGDTPMWNVREKYQSGPVHDISLACCKRLMPHKSTLWWGMINKLQRRVESALWRHSSRYRNFFSSLSLTAWPDESESVFGDYKIRKTETNRNWKLEFEMHFDCV